MRIESTMAQISSVPNFAPARVQTVTVPGPINAAAMMGPGPMDWKIFFKFKPYVFGKIEN